MRTTGQLNNGKSVAYGYGLQTDEYRSLKTIFHNGGWAGYRSMITNFPDEKLSIIILSNFAGFDVNRHSYEVAGIFLKEKFKDKPVISNKLKDAPTTLLDTLLAKKFTGTYLLRPGKVISITLENDQIMTQATVEAKFPTEPRSDSTIWIDAYSAPMTFVKNKKGEVNELKYRDLLLKKVTLWNPDAASINQFTGTYYSAELLTEYKIDLKNSVLTMHHMRLGDLGLNVDPTGADRFNGDLGSIVFFRSAKKKVIGLVFQAEE